jgi:hypothetical protein
MILSFCCILFLRNGRRASLQGETQSKPPSTQDSVSDFVIEQAILSNDDQPIRLDRPAVPATLAVDQ